LGQRQNRVIVFVPATRARFIGAVVVVVFVFATA
jgi:hypothetical protein